jgi:maltodextrin utilization protein YvdJ
MRSVEDERQETNAYMRTLRVKLTLPEPQGPRETFEAVSELHADQAIFQINQTEYVDPNGWGFTITYRSNETFVQTTTLAELEQPMGAVASNAFERRT